MIACALTIAAASAGDISIRLDGGIFVVKGWTPGAEPADGWQSIFAVYANSRSLDAPPLLGSYSIADRDLAFKPRFPLAAGMHYRAEFHAPDGKMISGEFDGPALDRTPTTRVEHVYPSINSLPENQLKFYIYFSAPMSRGEAWRRVHLMDGDGKEVQVPFLELNQELWDPEFKRLTVLFDPGRIKRGLASRAEEGPALVAGREYSLVLDADWKDARGIPLASEFRKQFQVVAADRTPPDPKNWRVVEPKAGTREPVVLKFGESMDYALSTRLVSIPNVAGAVSINADESEWRFTPAQPWKAGAYKIDVDTAIEDLAGNRVGREFDVDAFNRVTERIEKKSGVVTRTR